MNIIHVLLGTPDPDAMNGVEKSVHFLATEHAILGHDVEVWALGNYPSQPKDSRRYQLRFFSVARTRIPLAPQLKAALCKLPGRAWVQLHSVFIPEFAAIARSLQERRICYGLTPNGGYGSRLRNRLAKAAYVHLVEAHLVRNAASIHAVGETELAQIREIAPRAEVVLAPNGQNIDENDDELMDAGSLGRPIFGFCGRLDAEHKGLDLLLRGFAEYKVAGGTGTLWLLGDGCDRRQLERLSTALDLDESVSFLGAVRGREKVRLLNTLDVLVQTSRWDGLPLSCLEAASLGKPLLVTKETNLADHVWRCSSGWVLPSNTGTQIAAAMRTCDDAHVTGALVETGARAKAMVRDYFGWKTTAKILATEWQRHCGSSFSEAQPREDAGATISRIKALPE